MMNPSAPPSHTAAGSGMAQPDSIRDLVLVEQVKLLYANQPVSQVAALANGVVLAAVLSTVMEPVRVSGWLACLVAVSVARLYVGTRFARASLGGQEAQRWRTYFLAGATGAGLVWGAVGVILYPPDSVVYQVFVAFVLGGMTAGGAVMLAPVFPVFVLYATSALLPTIVRYLLEGDPIHYAMGGMGAIARCGPPHPSAC